MYSYDKFKELINKSTKKFTDEELQKLYDSLIHLAELNYKLIINLKNKS
jgi:hypothetical protein